MKESSETGPPKAALRWLLKLGKPVGVLLCLLAVAGVVHMQRETVPAHPSDSWPTEGYYFAGAQYQLTFQNLRLELARYHLSQRQEERIARLQYVAVHRDVLHAKYGTMVHSPELRPYFQRVKGFRDVVDSLTELDGRLNDLVSDALKTPEGLRRFDDHVDPLDNAIVRMVNDLRTAELEGLEAAFEAQRRATVAARGTGIALLAMLGVGLFLHVQVHGKEEQALRKEAVARAEAQRSAQARVALLGMVSHELRTPLQTMLASVEMLAITLTNEDARPAIEGLERSIEIISGQLDNIAQYTRLASGTFELRRERFEIALLLKRIVDEHRESAQPGQQLLLKTTLGADVVAEGDPIRLQQVINNFLSNAIKYAGPGVISISADLENSSAPAAVEDVVIEVEDSGPGISVSEQALIWEPFVRGRRGQGRPKGSGLGLAVVKLLADSAGWKVGVVSEAPRGTVFFVRFPLHHPTTETPSAPGRAG